jgi:hypothetical protein
MATLSYKEVVAEYHKAENMPTRLKSRVATGAATASAFYVFDSRKSDA